MICQLHDLPVDENRTYISSYSKPYHFPDSGLSNLYLIGIPVYQCAGCTHGGTPNIPEWISLARSLYDAVLSKDDHLDGEEIAFIRLCLSESQREFADKCGTPVSVIDKIEKTYRLPKPPLRLAWANGGWMVIGNKKP